MPCTEIPCALRTPRVHGSSSSSRGLGCRQRRTAQVGWHGVPLAPPLQLPRVGVALVQLEPARVGVGRVDERQPPEVRRRPEFRERRGVARARRLRGGAVEIQSGIADLDALLVGDLMRCTSATVTRVRRDDPRQRVGLVAAAGSKARRARPACEAQLWGTARREGATGTDFGCKSGHLPSGRRAKVIMPEIIGLHFIIVPVAFELVASCNPA